MARRAHRRVTRAIGDSDFDSPIEDRYFEDYRLGAVYEYGYASVTEREIMNFAREFDPQPFHVDRHFARTGPFGGLVASGFHTNAIFMRLFADHYLSHVASLGSPGLDELRWTTPLRPGDLLRLQTTVVEKRLSTSKPDRGIIQTKVAMYNHDDSVVLSLMITNFLRRRLTW